MEGGERRVYSRGRIISALCEHRIVPGSGSGKRLHTRRKADIERWYVVLSNWLHNRMKAIAAGDAEPTANIREAMIAVDESLNLFETRRAPLFPGQWCRLVYYVHWCDRYAAGTAPPIVQTPQNLLYVRRARERKEATGK